MKCEKRIQTRLPLGSSAEAGPLTRNAPPPDATEDLAAGRARLIPLTQGKAAIVDDELFKVLSKHKWRFHTGYAVRSVTVSRGKKRTIRMHRVIAGTPDELETDHINGDTLDNRSTNLRVCTHAENARNRSVQMNSTTGLKGVSVDKRVNKFKARIKVAGRNIWLGQFLTAELAQAAYRSACITEHGEFSRLA